MNPFPTDLEADDPAVTFAHLALTLLQQSHLCPLPLAAQPVHWAFDQALQLYPLPHALVLADGAAGQEEFRHEGCAAFSPVRGVAAVVGAWWAPTTRDFSRPG